MVPRVNCRGWVIVLGDVEPNVIQALLEGQSVFPPSAWYRRIRLWPYRGPKVIDERPTLGRTEQAGALQYDRIYWRTVVAGRVDAPAASGGTHVPKCHDGVARGARGYVGAAPTAAGDGVDGFKGPGIGKGERGGVGGAHVVDAHEAVEPARDDDLVRGTPRRRGWGGGYSVHGRGPLLVCGVALRLGRAERGGGRRGDGGGCDGVDGERGVGRGAKGGEGRRGGGGEEGRPGAGV